MQCHCNCALPMRQLLQFSVFTIQFLLVTIICLRKLKLFFFVVLNSILSSCLYFYHHYRYLALPMNLFLLYPRKVATNNTWFHPVIAKSVFWQLVSSRITPEILAEHLLHCPKITCWNGIMPTKYAQKYPIWINLSRTDSASSIKPGQMSSAGINLQLGYFYLMLNSPVAVFQITHISTSLSMSKGESCWCIIPRPVCETLVDQKLIQLCCPCRLQRAEM